MGTAEGKAATAFGSHSASARAVEACSCGAVLHEVCHMSCIRTILIRLTATGGGAAGGDKLASEPKSAAPVAAARGSGWFSRPGGAECGSEDRHLEDSHLDARRSLGADARASGWLGGSWTIIPSLPRMPRLMSGIWPFSSWVLPPTTVFQKSFRKRARLYRLYGALHVWHWMYEARDWIKSAPRRHSVLS